MNKWKEYTLGELCKIQSGGTPRRGKPGYYNGDIPWVKINDMNTNNEIVLETEERITQLGLKSIGDRLFSPGTILLAMYGSVGKIATAGVPLATNQAILGIQIVKDRLLDSNYLKRWLQSINTKLVFDARGVTQKNISATIVRNLKILLPALDEQKRIAAILDKADAIRRKRQKAIELTEEFLRSVFLDMFGEPVTNPKGWDELKMNDVISEIDYGTSQKANNDKRGFPILRMNNITYDGDIKLTDIKWCEIRSNAVDKYTVKKGDMLFNRTNSPELVGKTAVWDLDDQYAFAGYLIRVRFKDKKVIPQYVSGYLNSPYGKRLLFVRAKPAINMSNISASEFKKIPIPVPPIDIQKKYAHVIKMVKTKMRLYRDYKENADVLMNSLVQSAFRNSF